MNKQELVTALCQKSSLSEKKVRAVLDSFIETVREEVSNGETVTIREFGAFSMFLRKEKNGVNPSTGEKILYPPKFIPKFKASKLFKETVGKNPVVSL